MEHTAYASAARKALSKERARWMRRTQLTRDPMNYVSSPKMQSQSRRKIKHARELGDLDVIHGD